MDEGSALGAGASMWLSRAIHCKKEMESRWKERFQVVTSKNNPDRHEFYRAYFESPRAPRQRSMTLPRRSSPRPLPPLRLRQLEGLWDSRFHVSFSKDNPNFHVGFRQYFDSPKNLDYPLLSTQRQILDRKMRIGRKRRL